MIWPLELVVDISISFRPRSTISAMLPIASLKNH